MSHSGKFVLRVPPAIHGQLKSEALGRGISLNQLILEKLELSKTKKSNLPVEVQRAIELWKPLAIYQFGSTVRGQAKETSDIDLLIILDGNQPIDRSYYNQWDSEFKKTKYSPQFVKIPKGTNEAGSIWLEAALEGIPLYVSDKKVTRLISELKDKISLGHYRRKWSHGHPYWVRDKE